MYLETTDSAQLTTNVLPHFVLVWFMFPLLTWRRRGFRPVAADETRTVPVLEAVGDQLSFGQVIEPSQLPAAVSAGVERREALVASLQLQAQRHVIKKAGVTSPAKRQI